MKRVISIVTYLIIMLWVYAASVKLIDYPTFFSQLKAQPFPNWSITILSITLPAIEIILSILLLFKNTVDTGLLLSFILMFCFTIYILLALNGAFGNIPCACAGIIGRLPWAEHLIFNIFFTAIAFVGWYLQRHLKDENFVKHKQLTA